MTSHRDPVVRDLVDRVATVEHAVGLPPTAPSHVDEAADARRRQSIEARFAATVDPIADRIADNVDEIHRLARQIEADAEVLKDAVAVTARELHEQCGERHARGFATAFLGVDLAHLGGRQGRVDLAVHTDFRVELAAGRRSRPRSS
jgi:hypothetical protein